MGGFAGHKDILLAIFEVLKLKCWNISNEIEKFINFILSAVKLIVWVFSAPSHLIWTWQLAQHYSACDIWALKTQQPSKKSKEGIWRKNSVFSAYSIHLNILKSGPNQKYNVFEGNFYIQAPKWVGLIEKMTPVFTSSRSNVNPLSGEDYFYQD